MKTRQISNEALEVLIYLEGYKLNRYKDSAGLDTIGVGHLILKDDSSLKTVTGLDSNFVTELTEHQVGQLLQLDLAIFELNINLLLPELSQCMFDAAVLFSFNIGMRGFERSSVYANLKKGMPRAAAESIMLYKFVTVGGRKIVSKGLLKRRFIEASILTTPVLRPNLVNKELPTSLMNEAVDMITNYYSEYKG